MRLEQRFLIGLFALLTFVTETCFAAAAKPKWQTTYVRCTTQYCSKKLKTVPTKVVKTVYVTSHRSTTKTTYTGTRTITDPKRTKTIIVTVTPPTGTITHRTVYIYTVTAWSTLSTTVWITSTRSTSTTQPKTTVTRTPPAKTIPPLPGFTAIYNDPANIALVDYVPYFKRSAEPEALPEPLPEPEPEPQPEPKAKPPKYPKAVYCTKTLKTTTTTTFTKKIPKTTVTKQGHTTRKTRTAATPYVDYTLPGAPTVLETTYTLSTVGPTSTTTSWTTKTFYSTTVTVAAPEPTYYAACGPKNRAPPPGQQWFDGYNVQAYGLGSTEPGLTLRTNGTDYDCCVLCHTLPPSKGKCVGSLWVRLGVWGDPCEWPDCNPPEFADRAECHLFFPAAGAACKTRGFEVVSPYETPQAVANGPHCAAWKVGRV
ncbi:hypothetical protein ABW19_dt0205754 [Dactylella cylindrospora]|nr:hypothetical protein ABW19_dt0205754 [Dactylella cylindrospora]